ncbi:contractile injection system protein, VgrG/Pvc8 family [Chrysiogenes arsenatis]|uniref:contractile injection system protein, VgrG/Pvc8 family n=1 Tax=Chrysiogenes arsenatis TaxID=309797 RepID=UPI0003F9CDF2|nr:contractile injection system protein, VgrG/Pvc8 family [Chrysiogenes arsenatis]
MGLVRVRPDFRIMADAADVTAQIRDRLLSLVVTDAAGMESDTVEIALDDRDGMIELPRTGATLSVAMGYVDEGVMSMGRFVVDEVALSSPPQTLTIRARAADLRQGLKRPRTRPWEGKSIGDMVAQIAGEHGYTPKVADALASEVIPHIDQVDESDLNFLTRLARDRGAICKGAEGLLLFVPPGEAKSASGRDLPVVAATRQMVTSWEVTLAERGKYPAVSARWFDVVSATEQVVHVGTGEPVHMIRRRYPDQGAAQSAASAQLSTFMRGLATLRLRMVGRPDLLAESRLMLSGIRAGVDGAWSVSRVVHRLDSGGYTCEVEAESPKEEAV